MREPVILVWRRRADTPIFDVEASPNGSPRLIQQDDLEPGTEVLADETAVTRYLAESRVDQVAVTVGVANRVLGWEL